MVKMMIVVNPKPGTTQEEFGRYWLETHALIGKKIPGLRRYVVNLSRAGRGAPRIGGIAELWFDSMDALRAGMGSPEGKEAGKDLTNFGDPGTLVSVITDEHPVL